MIYKDYEYLISRDVITSDDIVDWTDRTLLYGYTCERESWHVYMKDEKIFTCIYAYEQKPVAVKIRSNEDYVPDKRLYPHFCDFEFCLLLKTKGIYLPFTTFTKTLKPDEKYAGEILT